MARYQGDQKPILGVRPSDGMCSSAQYCPYVRASSSGRKGTRLLCPNAQTGPTWGRGFGQSGLSGGDADVVVADGLAVGVHVAVVVHDRSIVLVVAGGAKPPVAVPTYSPVPTCQARHSMVPQRTLKGAKSCVAFMLRLRGEVRVFLYMRWAKGLAGEGREGDAQCVTERRPRWGGR